MKNYGMDNRASLFSRSERSTQVLQLFVTGLKKEKELVMIGKQKKMPLMLPKTLRNGGGRDCNRSESEQNTTLPGYHPHPFVRYLLCRVVLMGIGEIAVKKTNTLPQRDLILAGEDR